MKLQAVLIAVALGAGGAAAFAASDTASSADSTAKPATEPMHKAKSSKHHTSAHHTKSNKSNQHAKDSTHNMGAGGHHMKPAVANPQTDLQSRDRQGRIDQAYDKWKSGNS